MRTQSEYKSFSYLLLLFLVLEQMQKEIQFGPLKNDSVFCCIHFLHGMADGWLVSGGQNQFFFFDGNEFPSKERIQSKPPRFGLPL